MVEKWIGMRVFHTFHRVIHGGMVENPVENVENWVENRGKMQNFQV